MERKLITSVLLHLQREVYLEEVKLFYKNLIINVLIFINFKISVIFCSFLLTKLI